MGKEETGQSGGEWVQVAKVLAQGKPGEGVSALLHTCTVWICVVPTRAFLTRALGNTTWSKVQSGWLCSPVSKALDTVPDFLQGETWVCVLAYGGLGLGHFPSQVPHP